ncbi:hypothetical protein RHMOL_Rhmol13G0243100 [Rhododendron molle]|uniref:Uncharacterized protein n=1 Tax=Rhododendron molle TaxID=49168 RepID=A0ACC0LAM0_RHOML|nr:hypothetical protein RHMOL_Rhmol13G0243100 [Rhododendron molle]
MTSMSVIMVVAILAMATVMPTLFVEGIMDFHPIRALAAKNNVTCVLVFGDSSVDPGNNNHLRLAPKGNFPPYGKDLFDGHPTGRLSNGRLATDFIAEALGYTTVIPAFLDPTLTSADLLHGVSFASAGSGYDELTSNLSYFRHYKIHLGHLVGEVKAEEITSNAIYVLSMGSNDFLQNYYRELDRSQEFTPEQYVNFLAARMLHAVQGMHGLGARRMAVVGLSPIGCVPLVRTLKDLARKCEDEYNGVARSFNAKLQQNLATLKASLGMQIAYIDIYSVMMSAINTPQKYGFKETSKGCCGTGLYEYSETCRGMSTCPDPSKYVFWDAAHPTQRMYEIIAGEAVKTIVHGYSNN